MRIVVHPPDGDGDAQRVEQRWGVLNEPFTLRGGLGPAAGADWRIEEGHPGLLVAAVHGVRHLRPGRGWKAQDARTGGLARALAEASGWSVAYVLRADRFNGDANFDEGHPLKADLEKANFPGPGGILLDLHGMARSVAGADLAIGLGQADERSGAVAAALIAAATRNGLRASSDPQLTPFAGASSGTMTRWAQEQGAAAVQVELAPELRFDRMPRLNRLRLVATLLEAMAEAQRLRTIWRA